MERTSSLELFRGSDAFTSLAFLDGQEPSREANSGNIAAEGLQPSQAIPASIPVSSLHLAAPTQRPSKLLHPSRLAPGFSAWPPTTSCPYPLVAMQQPATARHTFLPFGSPASQHAAGTTDCQPDSFAALLADDTALGFADDCFRRESDLYLSQDRAVAAETAHHIALSSSDDYSSPAEQPQGNITPTQAAACESVPHDPTVGNPAPVTALAYSVPLQPPDVASVSQMVASAQPPSITSFLNPSPPALEDNLPAVHACITAADAHANRIAADAHTSGAEPQASHGQLPAADRNAGQTHPDAPSPTQVELQTPKGNGQVHAAQASASSPLVAALSTRDAVTRSLGACESIWSKPAVPLPRLPQQSAQSTHQAEAVMSPDGATAPGNAPDPSAHSPLDDEHPRITDLRATPAQVKADLHDAAADDGQAASQDCQLQDASQLQGSMSQQQKLGDGQAAVVRPKLAVQDYQLPLLQPAPHATASQGVHTSLPQDAAVGKHRGGSSGVCCSVLPAENAHCGCHIHVSGCDHLVQACAVM